MILRREFDGNTERESSFFLAIKQSFSEHKLEQVEVI